MKSSILQAKSLNLYFVRLGFVNLQNLQIWNINVLFRLFSGYKTLLPEKSGHLHTISEIIKYKFNFLPIVFYNFQKIQATINFFTA